MARFASASLAPVYVPITSPFAGLMLFAACPLSTHSPSIQCRAENFAAMAYSSSAQAGLILLRAHTRAAPSLAVTSLPSLPNSCRWPNTSMRIDWLTPPA